LPPPDGYPGYAQYDRKGWWWFNFIEGLYKKSAGRKTVLFCPSKHLGNPLLKDNILCGNYGVNQSVCKSSMGRRSCAEFVGKPVQLTEMPHPSQTVLVVDSGYSIINWWHAADRPPTTLGKQLIEDTAYVPGLSINKDRRFWSGQEEDAIGGRHPNKRVNIGYADGHLAIMKADELLVEKSGDSYKNRSPTWLPK
jgi:prepilin-type processing-associated H-X9-DG protein